MGMYDDNEKGANKGAYGAYATVFFCSLTKDINRNERMLFVQLH